MSPTENGSVQDKTIADEYPLIHPDESALKQDLGFIGHYPKGAIVEIPFKKPQKSELTFGQQIYNKIFNATRVVTEHANNGVKRLKMIKDTVRIHSTVFRDNLIAVACALHNLRVKSPLGLYQHAPASA